MDFPNLMPDLEGVLAVLNNFFELAFTYMKYIFVGILLIIGILTLLSLRGRFFLERLRYSKEEKLANNPLTTPRLVIGSLYIIFALGILFNWFTYLLIIILDPLPDRYIFVFVKFTGAVDPYYLNRISNLHLAEFEWEKSIYYGSATLSFIAILDIMISIWQIVNGGGQNVKKSVLMLIGGILMGMMVGFTTCLPLFL